MHDGSPLGLSASQTVGTAVRAVLHATMQTMLEPWEHSNLHLLRRDGNNLLPISAILVSHMLKIKRNAKENGTYIVTWIGSFAHWKQGLKADCFCSTSGNVLEGAACPGKSSAHFSELLRAQHPVKVGFCSSIQNMC